MTPLEKYGKLSTQNVLNPGANWVSYVVFAGICNSLQYLHFKFISIEIYSGTPTCHR